MQDSFVSKVAGWLGFNSSQDSDQSWGPPSLLSNKIPWALSKGADAGRYFQCLVLMECTEEHLGES
jgi:hypothetical protein